MRLAGWPIGAVMHELDLKAAVAYQSIVYFSWFQVNKNGVALVMDIKTKPHNTRQIETYMHTP